MGQAVRNHVRRLRSAAQPAASRRLATRRPEQLRQPANGKIRTDAWRRCGERGRSASDLSAAAADRLLLQPVSVLLELVDDLDCVSNLGAFGANHTGAIPAGPFPFPGSGDAARL